MAGSKSTYLENAVLNGTLRNTGIFAQSGSVYVSLHSADPTDAGSGTELSGGSYARVAVARGTGSWDAPADDSGAQKTQNTNAITFPTSSGSQGNATHFGIWDASTSGNLLYHGDLAIARNINAGGITVSFAAGELEISEA